MQGQGLQQLFVQGLQAVYSAEQQGLQAAQEIARNASDPQLQQLLQDQTQRAQGQIQRLEQAMGQAGASTEGIDNPIMRGILEAGQRIMSEAPDADTRDAGIIASGQIALHYYMAAYGTLRSYAQALGNQEAAEQMGQVLAERKEQDQQMTQLAEQVVNPQAS
ncbi:hypothetical protein DAETH_40730 (plasmid) [Deinococcus aetherius]|uniref:DUF892 family protein n=2 Tax=Deinococcus aetherius TaxID=200252 RepID=A0ABM8AJW0_9DEIO|nr:hypothetical protein DAETH_40730 [Deinococcus aetherius]